MAQRLRLWLVQQVRLGLAQRVLERLGLDCLVQVQQGLVRQQLARVPALLVLVQVQRQPQQEPALQRVVFWVGRRQPPFQRLQRWVVLWRLLLRAVAWPQRDWLGTWRRQNPTCKPQTGMQVAGALTPQGGPGVPPPQAPQQSAQGLQAFAQQSPQMDIQAEAEMRKKRRMGLLGAQ